MEERLEDQETSSRGKSLIMAGPKVPQVSRGDHDLKNAVCEVLKRINYELSASSVVEARRIGAKPGNQAPDRRKIIFKLSDWSLKQDVLRACKA